jgi:glutaredoxin
LKKLLIIIAVLFVATQWPVLRDALVPPKDYSYLGKTYVTMYSTSWCGYCAKARRFMDRNQIAYTDLDIEKSEQANRQYESLGGGGIPLIVVNGQIIQGYDPDSILRYLDQIAVPVS